MMDLVKLAETWSRTKRESATRTTGFYAGVATPLVVGRIGKSGGVVKHTTSLFQGQQFKTVSALAATAKPGDILLVSHGSNPLDLRKMFVSLGTGMSEGYHTAIVSEVNSHTGRMALLELNTNGYKQTFVRIKDLDNFSLLRIDDPKKGLMVRDNMKKLVKTQRALVMRLRMNGMPQAEVNKVARHMYYGSQAPLLGIRELFIPYLRDRTAANAAYVKSAQGEINALSNNIFNVADDITLNWKKTGKLQLGALKPMRRVCTNIAAIAGVPVGAKSHPGWAAPNDLLRSGKVKTIGYKLSPKYSNLVKVYDALLKLSPDLLRAGAGIGLGTAVVGGIVAKQTLNRYNRRSDARKIDAEQIKKGLRQIRVDAYRKRDGKYVESYVKTVGAS